eukprot:403367257
MELESLKFKNNVSNGLYENPFDQNAIETILSGFYGKKLSISGGKLSKIQTKNQLFQSNNLQHFKFENIQINEAALVILLQALGQQENLKSLEFVQLNITTKNAEILIPLRQCSQLRSLKFDRFLIGTYESYEVVLRYLGPKIQEFTLIVHNAKSIDHVSDVISHFDSKIIKSINLDVRNFIKNQDYLASTRQCLQILQYYTNLKKLSLHVGQILVNKLSYLLHIDKELLDPIGIGLLKFGAQLEELTLVTNYSGITPETNSKYNQTTISSYQEKNLHQQDSKLFDTFCLGLASCINLKFLNLPRDMLNMHFFDSYYKALDQNQVKSNLIRMSQVPLYKSCRPEICRSFLF